MHFEDEEKDLREQVLPEQGLTNMSKKSRLRACTSPRFIFTCLTISLLLHILLWRSSRFDVSMRPHKSRVAPEKAVVISSHKELDVDWASKLSDDWWVFRYVLDDNRVTQQAWPQNFASMSNAQRVHPNNTFTVARQTGREAMVYLTFIIDNYDNLPLFTYFVHGHEKSWHQPESILDKIHALNFTALASHGYTNLGCHDRRLCTEERVLDFTHGADGIKEDGFKPIPQFWKLVFGPKVPLPRRFANPWAAQFAVTRENILARPLEFWKAMRRPLERDLSEYKEELSELLGTKDPKPEYRIGVMYEMLWHVFMGMPNVYCTDPDYCRQTIFSGALSCVEPDDGRDDHDFATHDLNCTVDEEARKRAAKTQEQAIKAANKRLQGD